MLAYTLSNLELRGIIESGFLPHRCHCTIMDNTMTVEVIDPLTARVELFASGIRLDRLDTSRALCELISELRAEVSLGQSNDRQALAS
ncbi:DUF1652 domain-containing protein [Pseudomonas sp. GD03842]|uniref:DUF1652 domain-containing protein n=1 Tax=Pseudomonas sp. GD03842 TaxID=2975385 RepID=UPI0024491578|nr:DUF1652 domain-containing protein [Pseudomonas sp. GD03842]MDH0745469.1 DUF1652 domain-containing protein [Pseudomonas sp. GD03842]